MGNVLLLLELNELDGGDREVRYGEEGGEVVEDI
jgi:hypothetical protein